MKTPKEFHETSVIFVIRTYQTFQITIRSGVLSKCSHEPLERGIAQALPVLLTLNKISFKLQIHARSKDVYEERCFKLNVWFFNKVNWPP